jgi:hypothetical protein
MTSSTGAKGKATAVKAEGRYSATITREVTR